MRHIWVISELAEVAAQLLTPASEFAGHSIHAIATDAKGAAALASLGAQKVYQLCLEDGRFESAVPIIAKLIKEDGASAVLFGATPRGKGVAASVAAMLDCALASEACTVRPCEAGMEAVRYVLGGTAVSTAVYTGTGCATILPNTFKAPESSPVRGEVVVVDVPADTRVKVLQVKPTECESVDLASARRVVCVGRGLAKQEDLAIINSLCEAADAEIACSRSMAEDLGWLPLDRYVGISGVKLKADLLVSAGVSGQAQHVAGLRDVKVVVAVNTNENAPIFAAADYGIVGDLYEVVPELTRALQA